MEYLQATRSIARSGMTVDELYRALKEWESTKDEDEKQALLDKLIFTLTGYDRNREKENGGN